VTTPGPGGPQPPEQDPAQSGQPQNWGQQSPAGQPFPGQPFPGQQPPAGQQPWGAPQQPGGVPQQPGGAQAFGQPQQPAKKNKWLPIVLGAVLVIAVIGLVLSFLGGNSAQAGDCVNGEADEIGVVDCADSEAAFKVAGVLEDISQNELESDPTVCTDDWPESVAYAWEGTDPDDADAEGTGYCLADLGS